MGALRPEGRRGSEERREPQNCWSASVAAFSRRQPAGQGRAGRQQGRVRVRRDPVCSGGGPGGARALDPRPPPVGQVSRAESGRSRARPSGHGAQRGGEAGWRAEVGAWSVPRTRPAEPGVVTRPPTARLAEQLHGRLCGPQPAAWVTGVAEGGPRTGHRDPQAHESLAKTRDWSLTGSRWPHFGDGLASPEDR